MGNEPNRRRNSSRVLLIVSILVTVLGISVAFFAGWLPVVKHDLPSASAPAPPPTGSPASRLPTPSEPPPSTQWGQATVERYGEGSGRDDSARAPGAQAPGSEHTARSEQQAARSEAARSEAARSEQQAARSEQTGRSKQASRSKEASRSEDLRASKSQEVRAPRSQDVQAPRGEEVQAPRGEEVQAPSRQDVQESRTIAAAASAAPSRPLPEQIVWNTWGEPAFERSFKPLPFLKPGTEYRITVDLAPVAYKGRGVSVAPISRTFRKDVDDWLADGVTEVRLRVVLLHDPERFDRPNDPVQTVILDLNRVRAHPPGTPTQADPFNEMRDSSALGKWPPFVYGRTEFVLSTRSVLGPAGLAFSIWSKDRPADEFSGKFCIAPDQVTAQRLCSDSDPLVVSLRGIDSVRLAGEPQANPDGALHFVEMPGVQAARSQVFGVFWRRHPTGSGFVTWRLETSPSTLEYYLANTVLPAFYKVTDEAALQALGRSLYNMLFPQDPDRLDSAAARKAFEDFLANNPRLDGESTSSATPSIFVRTVWPSLGSELMLPIGFLVVRGTFVGFSFRIESPLLVQSYKPSGTCINQWVMALPPKAGTPGSGSALDDALGVFSKLIDAQGGWGATTRLYRNMRSVRDWLSDGIRDTEPSAFFVTSHHARDTLYFKEDDPILSKQIEHRFGPSSVAILNGCGTGKPGATDIINELSRRYVGAVIATSTEVRGEMAGWFLACLADGVEKSPPGGTALGELHFSAIKCLADKQGRHAKSKYGGQALAYMMLGNSGLRICSPSRNR